MSRPRIFISSTVYDLMEIRSGLRHFLESIGYEPVQSDFGGVTYDPGSHTRDSCLREIHSCDAVVLLIGSRFGAVARSSPELTLDQDAIAYAESNPGRPLSITQAEAFKSADDGIPVFPFIYRPVLHDYRVYRSNRGNGVSAKIHYPSIEDQDSAQSIFDFIAYLKTRSHGNAIHPFDRLDDILIHLKGQWAGLFQEYLRQLRRRDNKDERLDKLAESVRDLQSVIFASAPQKERETARAALRFRRLMDVLREVVAINESLNKTLIFTCEERLLRIFYMAGIRIIYTPGVTSDGYLRKLFLKTVRGDVYEAALSRGSLKLLEADWDQFIKTGELREIIYSAYEDSNTGAPRMMFTPVEGGRLRLLPEQFTLADVNIPRIEELADASDEGDLSIDVSEGNGRLGLSRPPSDLRIVEAAKGKRRAVDTN